MMLHYYAPGVWNHYGVPFDRLESLFWDDFLMMARTVEHEHRKAAQQ